MDMIVKWRTGAVGNIPAQDAYEALEVIRQETGGDLTAKVVVDAARPKGHMLHPQVFDRPVKDAAEQYYLERARSTIRSLVTVRTVATQEDPVEVRVFSQVESGRAVDSTRTAYVYSSTEEALQDPVRREYVLAEAIRQVAVWRKKYAALSELAQVFHAIDEIAI